MKLGRLNHVGVATPSIEASIAFWRDVMGAQVIHAPFDMPAQLFRAHAVTRHHQLDHRVHQKLVQIVDAIGHRRLLESRSPCCLSGETNMACQ